MSKVISGLFVGTKGERASLISQLDNCHEKYNKEDLIDITTDTAGNIVWLEKGHLGDRPSGLVHILQRHASDFQKHGIDIAEIPRYIMSAIHYGKIVSYQGRGKGRPIYEFQYKVP